MSTDKEKAARLVADAFSLSEENLREINGLFRAYLFRRGSTGEIWSTCCGRHVRIDERTGTVRESGKERCAKNEELFLLYAGHVPQEKWRDGKCVNRLDAMQRVKCPWCGADASVKELRYSGQRKNLYEYQRAAVLRQREDGLWVQCYDCMKDYTHGELTRGPELGLLGVYRFCGDAMLPPEERSKPFRLDRAEAATRYWRNSVFGYRTMSYVGKMRSWMLSAPYGNASELGRGYDAVGLDELRKSDMRWLGVEEIQKKCDLLRLLSLCCFYPKQVEWLHKVGLDEGITDYVERGVKNAAAIHWDAEDPKEFLGLGKKELQTMRVGKGSLEAVGFYRSCKGKESLEDCITLTKELCDKGKEQQIGRLLRTYGIGLSKLLKYAEAQRVEKQILRTVLMEYVDYAQAAEGIGLNLHNPVFAFPKNFREKHDSVTRAYANLQEERANEEAMKKYLPRYRKLDKKYTFSLDGFEIQVPRNGTEIAQEGKRLCHCVGGYAERHLKGATTILFLRRSAQRDTPLVTIEMKENKIVQIHGYDDERTACPENPNKTPCRKLYDYFLEPWLQWLSDGSKRDKEGKPILRDELTKTA